MPHSIMLVIISIAAFGQFTIAEQYRKGRLIALHPHGIDRQIIRPINKGDNPAKALCLTLGAQHSV